MKILIIPTIREIYKNQFEFCVDLRLTNFLKKIFKKPSIEIFNDTIKPDYDLIVFVGGNNSITQNRADKVRNKINHMIYNYFFKKKIYMLGICHGAHFLAKKNSLILGKKKNHIGSHKVIFKIYKNSFKKVVNSYHSEIIRFKKIDKGYLWNGG